MITRRTALQMVAATPWLGALARGEETAAPRPRTNMGLVIHSFWVRRERPLTPEYSAISDPADFVAAAAKFGAAGIQTGLGMRDVDYVKRLRNTLEKHEIYLEGIGFTANVDMRSIVVKDNVKAVLQE